MNLDRNSKKDQETNLLSQAIYRYVPYWPLFLILILLGFGVAWFYIRFSPSLYESTAKILIKDERKGAENTKAFEELNLLATKKIIENEVDVIQSRTLLNEVVKHLLLYAPVFEEKLINNVSAYTNSPIRIKLKDADMLSTVPKVPFTYDSKN